MTKEAVGVGGTDQAQTLADGRQQIRVGPGLGLAQVSLDL